MQSSVRAPRVGPPEPRGGTGRSAGERGCSRTEGPSERPQAGPDRLVGVVSQDAMVVRGTMPWRTPTVSRPQRRELTSPTPTLQTEPREYFFDQRHLSRSKGPGREVGQGKHLERFAVRLGQYPKR